MKTNVRSTRWGIVALVITLAHAGLAAAESPTLEPDDEPDMGAIRFKAQGSPVRVARRVTLSGVFDTVFFGRGGLPLGGLALSVNLAPWIALDVVASTIGLVTTLSGGAKAYLLQGTTTPYFFGRVGALLLTVGEEVEGAAILGSFGGGLEVSLSGGFNLFAELGAIKLPRTDSWAGRYTMGVGYRF
jgi:hypothetical protein